MKLLKMLIWLHMVREEDFIFVGGPSYIVADLLKLKNEQICDY